ncbi:hypothetical protein B0T16DRAFT_191427 [Cercophora newfieldiana]|uniref:Uncharacterized protein n=1 Tax=Cercophora newfieldiana TaxID=92897 RepID=A0AA39Y0X2_9PEZI|nr:hypothetical protein B0T16DRAFT_191427 [Cercophora newfieldiana]
MDVSQDLPSLNSTYPTRDFAPQSTAGMCFVADMDDSTSDYVLTTPPSPNHGPLHSGQTEPMPAHHLANLVGFDLEKASIPRSSAANTRDIGATAVDDLESIISDTFDRLYASWGDGNLTEREDSPFKNQRSPNPVSPAVAFRVIYESERINKPTTVKGPTLGVLATAPVKRMEHFVGQQGLDGSRRDRLPNMTTAKICAAGGEHWEAGKPTCARAA